MLRWCKLDPTRQLYCSFARKGEKGSLWTGSWWEEALEKDGGRRDQIRPLFPYENGWVEWALHESSFYVALPLSRTISSLTFPPARV
jgi:hypothetical protein